MRQIETQIRKNQKVIKNDNNQILVKIILKKSIGEQPKITLTNCPTCSRTKYLQFHKGYYCRNCEYINNKQKQQVDNKVLRQEIDFSTRLNYANKKMREIWMNTVNTTYNSTEDMMNKLQDLKRKTKLNFYKNVSN